MNTHRCPGLPSTGLMTYLAALGLAKVIGEQADAAVRFGWSGETFVLQTSVPDPADFLVSEYRPTPVVSPWNGGSGFGAKDKSQRGFLEQLHRSKGDRLALYRATIEQASYVMRRPEALSSGWDKGRLVQELRNRLPDEALAWVDASVVLTLDLDKPVFPPLIGTGGNDGRLEYSSNFHQRLIEVLPDLGASPRTSAAWARDLLTGQQTARLQNAAVGQFDPLGAGGPGSSVFGSADSRVNPWAFVLMIEGVMWFASSSARRLGETAARAAMPFTVRSSPDGPTPGAADEPARGELWAPVFHEVSLRHLRQIMSEARATWQGSAALTAAQMYGAVHTFGVDRGIERFQRFGYLQRNGRAFVAVLLDTVLVRREPLASLAAAPLLRAETFRRASGAAAARHTRVFNRAATRFVRDPNPDGLVALLGASTQLEITATRSEGNRRELLAPRRLATARDVVPALDSLLERSAEARVAAGIASSAMPGENASLVPMRELLLGSDPGQRTQREPVAQGLGSRPLVDVLADVLVWRAQHPVEDRRTARGVLPFAYHAYRTRWRDVHAWAAGNLLDDELVEDYLLAFLALDWRRVKFRPSKTARRILTVDPDLAVLQAFASGRVVVQGTSVDTGEGAVGLCADWPLRLRAGQVRSVCRDAATLLGRCQVRKTTHGGELSTATAYEGTWRSPGLPTRGPRLLAALTAPATTGALRAIGAIRSPDHDQSITSLTADEGALA
ncbi:MAG: type I-G CRISPR-associated protein Cas8g1/Csx17 [Dermatophilaceae bacterium]